eukprot:m.15731 g.15731  ORF g.15731 m.15731 type:complete len:143 (+) comp10719_c0_seq1:492-920(+)
MNQMMLTNTANSPSRSILKKLMLQTLFLQWFANHLQANSYEKKKYKRTIVTDTHARTSHTLSFSPSLTRLLSRLSLTRTLTYILSHTHTAYYFSHTTNHACVHFHHLCNLFLSHLTHGFLVYVKIARCQSPTPSKLKSSETS